MNKKFIIIGIIGSLFIGFLAWLFIESSKPLPGQKIDDLGRGHVQIGEKVEYNSNPPTSGKHYEEWIKAGIYDEPKDDRNLVHSLEHGYIVMSYKCKLESSGNLSASLETGSQESSKSAEATGSAQMDGDCEERMNQFVQVYEKKGKRKLIVVPRFNLDTNFALTAWAYLDKFDQFDESRIEKFIDAHLDMGPEKTME